ncbi:PREDICTED: disintegrin and metalloproteinase domain-containing protein 5-like, partial [Chinchilla lanigera]
MDEFKQIVSQPGLECLQNQTVPKVVYESKNAVCGNGVVELHEQCDCGQSSFCAHTKCCKPEACTLIGTAECGSGQCCHPDSCS